VEELNDQGPLTANQESLLEGLELVKELIRIRDDRVKNLSDVESAVATLDEWNENRLKWWQLMLDARDEGHWMPLLDLAERLKLNSHGVDILLIVLAPLIDPELIDSLLPKGRLFAQNLNVKTVLSLLFHSSAERFAEHHLIAQNGRLISSGLIHVSPSGGDQNANSFEIRATDTLANFVLERPLLSGVMTQFCELGRANHRWNQVILDEEQKSLIWNLVAGESPMRQNLSEWGYDEVLTTGSGIVLLFAGPPGTGKTAFAHAIAERLGREVLRVSTASLLAAKESLEPVLDEVFRVGQMANAVVVMDDCESMLSERNTHFLSLLQSLERNNGLLILTTNNAQAIDFAMARRILYRLDFERPSAYQREGIWYVHLPPDAPLNEDIDVGTLAAIYEFSGAQIRNTVLIALSNMMAAEENELTMAHLRNAAETQLGARFDNMAVKSVADFGIDRLILPEREMDQLKEVLSACRHREYVLNRWGFGKRLPTGRGLCILFDGPPGTGKTFTAEILAHELKLPLYRVHIPNIVSKWVGETERNIAEIFVRARAARAMLLFDEADSLFGRRSTGGQGGANDRYANMEVNLLLQEIERYDGITVLTTNLYGNLDDALQRRIQFRVTFPFPESEERANIWQILMPPEAPVDEEVDYEALGKRFELAGGHIKNALLRAAYRARDDDGDISQTHLIDAAVAECRAQGKIVRAFEPKKRARPTPVKSGSGKK
jgi:SpoVK/Ycf46/Vps4 family AAA+-type ATPase